MPLDTSLNSAYLSSRFGEDPLPRMVRSPRLGERKDGFDEELVQPELNIKLPYDVGALQSLVMSWFGAPGTIQVRDGGVAGTTSGTGTGIGTSGRAGGPSVYSYLTAANQDIFGERPLGHPYVTTATTSLPNSATLWPPSPSAINLTDPASAHGGPSGMNAESTWYTPTQLATQITSALNQEFIVKTANPLLPNALVLVAGAGIAAPVVDTPGEIHVDIDVPGSDTQILYNNAGALGASASLRFIDDLELSIGDGDDSAALTLYAKASDGQPAGVQFNAVAFSGFVCNLSGPATLTASQNIVLPDLSGTVALMDAANAGGFTLANGDIVLATAGNGIYIAEGSDATMGTATLSGGTVTVSTTKVTANSRIFLTVQSLGTVAVPMAIGVTARTASTSFTITSADATDTSVVAWVILEPA